MKIGSATIMLFDSRDGWAPTTTFLNLYAADVEEAHAKALELGATSAWRSAWARWPRKRAAILR